MCSRNSDLFYSAKENQIIEIPEKNKLIKWNSMF